MQKFKTFWKELPIWLNYRVVNTHDQEWMKVKVLLLVSHAIVKKWTEEVRSIFVNNVFLTYQPTKPEIAWFLSELQGDHNNEAQRNWYTLHYDIPLEKRHITDTKPF